METLRPHVDVVIAVGDSEGIDALSMLADHTYETRAATPFHFGATLQHIIQAHGLSGALYFGSGSGSLIESRHAQAYAEFARREYPAALFNNFYSCDYGVFSQAHTLCSCQLPEVDNGLGFSLADSGIDCYQLPRTAATQFDIDTPTDLLLAKNAGRGGPRLAAALQEMELEHASLERILALLTDRSQMLYLVGRVNPGTWRHFEREVACQTSGMIEGRGMKATASRRERVLARLVREMGIETFFSALEACADGALIDTRPLLAGPKGVLPPPDVRFNSDLMRLEEIHDPIWRALTERAADSYIPILLGGHSLISGGLFLLAEVCWKGRDLPRRLHPEPFEREVLPNESDRAQTSD